MQRVPEPEYMDIEEEAYAYAVADFNDVNAAFVNRLMELVGPQKNNTVLDLGTGPGDIPLRISGLQSDWRVVGVDASAAMLRRAVRYKINSGIQTPLWYVLCDAKQLPFPAGSFSIVISNSILHHVADTVVFWFEVKRMLPPGGMLFLRDLSRPDSEGEAARVVSAYSGNESAVLQEEFYRSLLAAYTPEEVRRQLEDAGLSVMNVAQVTDRHLDVWGVLK